MQQPNEAQIALWNEEVGRRWTEQQSQLDAFLAPFGAALLARVKAGSGERILDVGCGCGDTSLALAAAVGPTGGVVGVDVSAPMLARARERAAGVAQLRFLLADAAHADLDGPYDRLVSRFGVMFFDAPAPAFAHLRAATKPGGAMTFIAWRTVAENGWASVPARAVIAAIGAPEEAPAPHAPGPFAFAEEARVRSVLAEAGWRAIAFERFDAPLRLGADAAEAARWSMQVGPAGAMLREADDDRRARARAAMEAAFAPLAGADGVSLPGACWIVSATA
jgi:SAM-dependent methyltransferase